MLGSTAPLSIWGNFDVGCYSYWVPAESVFLSMIGVTIHVIPTDIDVRENLLGVVFSRPSKNHIYYLFLCSLITGIL